MDWAYVISTEPNPPRGYTVVVNNTETSVLQKWDVTGEAGVRIAVDDDIWVVDAQNRIYRGGALVGGAAKDIGAGGGEVWIIGDAPNPPYGDTVYRYTNDPNSPNPWVPMPGAGTRIAVGRDGEAWIVNAQKRIYAWNGSAFIPIGGAAKDIGAGGGEVWIIGDAPNPPYGDTVYRYTNDPNSPNPWVPMPGAGTNIAVGESGKAWITNAQNNIYRWNGAVFEIYPGFALDVAPGKEMAGAQPP